MAEREWWCVETPTSVRVGGIDGAREFTNREAATTVARNLAPQHDEPLTVVRYTRREIRTFRKKVTIEEADVPTTA